jgi:hypothetical protein
MFDWTSIDVTVDWPLGVQSGSLEADDQYGRLTTLTTGADDGSAVDWRIPLNAATGQRYNITLISSLVYHDSGLDCGPIPTNIQIRLHVNGVTYRTVTAQQTIASYLSGVINHVVIRVPATPDHDVTQATLQMASMLVTADLDQNVAFTVQSDTDPVGTVGPFERIVTIEPASKGSIDLSTDPGVGIVIQGAGATLADQVQLLRSRAFPLLQVQHTDATNVPANETTHDLTLNLAALGLTNLTASGVGTFSIPVGFDQSATGQEIAGLKYAFAGTNQAPSRDTGATVTLFDGSTPLKGTTLQDNAGWHINGVVPPALISRYLALTLQVSYYGGVGSCNALLPISVAVNLTSTVTATPGFLPTETGFAELPELLVPHADVLLTDPSLSELALGVQMVAGAQRMTATPLALTLLTGSHLPAHAPVIVVCDDSSPLASQLRPSTVSDGSALFTVYDSQKIITALPESALLTAGHLANGDAVFAVVGSSTAPAAARELLGAVGSESDNWLGLTGDTATLAPGNQVATASISTATEATVSQAAKTWLSNKGVKGGVLVFLLALAFLLFRAYRRRGRRPSPTGEATSS